MHHGAVLSPAGRRPFRSTTASSAAVPIGLPLESAYARAFGPSAQQVWCVLSTKQWPICGWRSGKGMPQAFSAARWSGAATATPAESSTAANAFMLNIVRLSGFAPRFASVPFHRSHLEDS